MGYDTVKPCPCGSGLYSWWMTDCKGIPLDRVCENCEETKKKKYNKWVFDGYTQADIDEQIEED